MLRRTLILASVVFLAGACGKEKLFVVPEPEKHEDRLCQDKASRIDILFVIDDSASMVDEQNLLAENFEQFLLHIDPKPQEVGEDGEVDYRLAVTTTNIHKDGELEGTVKILKPGNSADPLADFQRAIRVGVGGSSQERGLEMALKALRNAAGVMENKESQFLRKGAYLYVIFVADEDDFSPAEVRKYHREMIELKNLEDRSIVVSAVVGLGTEDEDCGDDTAAVGERYLDLVRLTGGVEGSICTKSWAETLTELAVKGIGLRKQFQLEKVPKDLDGDGYDPGDLEVWIEYPCVEEFDEAYAACPEALRTDSCGAAEPVRICRPPAFDDMTGWDLEEETYSIRFAPSLAPPQGTCAVALYFERDRSL